MTVSHIPRWLLGVLLCIFATAATALGLVLQKMSHTLNEQSKKTVVYYRQPWWLVGFAIFMVSQIVNVIPMASTPQVMLSCLGATALIFNAIFASVILREDLHLFEVGVMAGIVCGVVMVISTTPVAPPLVEESLHDIVGPLITPVFLSVLVCCLFCLALLRFGVLNSSLAEDWPDLNPLVWTLMSAVSSGYTVNLFKAVSQFLVTWRTTQPYLHIECFVILVSALVFGASQIHCLNRALNLGRAMMVVPTYFALALLSQLLLSEVVDVCFPDTSLRIFIFASGIVVILVLVAVLARAKIAYEEEPDAEFEDVMKKISSWSPKAFDATKSPKFLPSLSPRQTSMPNMRGDMEQDVDFGENVPLIRPRTMSAFDHECFLDSFEGRERTYTVSVIGGLGVA